eukprot:11826453-Alexandrium_andersonii.AAC.1
MCIRDRCSSVILPHRARLLGGSRVWAGWRRSTGTCRRAVRAGAALDGSGRPAAFHIQLRPVVERRASAR